MVVYKTTIITYNNNHEKLVSFPRASNKNPTLYSPAPSLGTQLKPKTIYKFGVLYKSPKYTYNGGLCISPISILGKFLFLSLHKPNIYIKYYNTVLYINFSKAKDRGND